jgi:hypothetical protein
VPSPFELITSLKVACQLLYLGGRLAGEREQPGWD